MISHHCILCPNRIWYLTICISSTPLYFDMVCNFPLHISVLHIFYTFPPDGIMVLDRYNVKDRRNHHEVYDRVFNSETEVPIRPYGWGCCVTAFLQNTQGFINTDLFGSITTSSFSFLLRMFKMFSLTSTF